MLRLPRTALLAPVLAAMSLACSLWRADAPDVPDNHPVDFPRAHRSLVAGVPLLRVPARVGTAAVGVSLRLGITDDPRDRPGLTALLLALLRGHGEGPGSLAAALGELGGVPELVVGQGGALLATEVPAEHAPAALAALLAALRRPLTDPDELAIIAAELAAARERARDDPSALALAGLRRVGFPPGDPRARSELSGRTWSLEHVLAARSSIAPGELALVVAGEADERALAAAATAGLAHWPAPPRPISLADRAAPSTAQPTRTAARAIHLLARPGLPQAVIAVGAVSDGGDELAASVAEILIQSALHDRLRTRMAATYSVEAGRDLTRGPGLVHVLTRVDAAAVAPALLAVQEALAALRRGPVHPDVVARVCALERLTPMFARQSNAGLLHAATRSHWLDLPDDHDLRRAARDCAALTPAVVQALRADLDPARLQIVVVGDPSLRAALAELGDVVRLDPATL